MALYFDCFSVIITLNRKENSKGKTMLMCLQQSPVENLSVCYSLDFDSQKKANLPCSEARLHLPTVRESLACYAFP